MANIPDLQVVLPYKTLVQLLESAQAVSELRQALEFRDQQLSAMRGQLTEVFEVIGQIRQELRSYHD